MGCTYDGSNSTTVSITGSVTNIAGGNLDDLSGWQSCAEASCNPVAPSYHEFNQQSSSPSIDGSAIETYQYGPPNWGILYYYTHFLTPQEAASVNFKVQWQFYVDSDTYVQALEFDFPVIYNNLAFYFGTQCVKGGFWQYWDPNVHQWNDITSAPCYATGPGTWHKLSWYGTRSGSQFTYQCLQIDGQQYPVGITLNAPSNSTGIANNTITIQFQPDGNGANPNPGYHEYIDDVQAWVW